MSFTANYAHSRVSKLKIENHNIKTFSYFYFVNPWLEFCGWFFALSLSDFEFWLRTQILIGWDQKTLIKLEPKLIIPDVSLFCQKSLVKAKNTRKINDDIYSNFSQILLHLLSFIPLRAHVLKILRKPLKDLGKNKSRAINLPISQALGHK